MQEFHPGSWQRDATAGGICINMNLIHQTAPACPGGHQEPKLLLELVLGDVRSPNSSWSFFFVGHQEPKLLFGAGFVGHQERGDMHFSPWCTTLFKTAGSTELFPEIPQKRKFRMPGWEGKKKQKSHEKCKVCARGCQEHTKSLSSPPGDVPFQDVPFFPLCPIQEVLVAIPALGAI